MSLIRFLPNFVVFFSCFCKFCGILRIYLIISQFRNHAKYQKPFLLTPQGYYLTGLLPSKSSSKCLLIHLDSVSLILRSIYIA